MGIILYNFSKSHFNSSTGGLFGSDIKQREVKKIWVSYSELSEDKLKNELSDSKDLSQHPALAFQNISKESHRQVPSLPIRFPTVVKDDKDIDALVENNRTDIYQHLNLYGQCQEHAFFFKSSDANNLSQPGDLNEKKGPGTAYLKKKLATQSLPKINDNEKNNIVRALTDLFHEEVLSVHSKMNEDGIKVHLLSHNHWQPTTRSIQLLSEKAKGQEVYFLGTYPPFHFAQLNLY